MAKAFRSTRLSETGLSLAALTTGSNMVSSNRLMTCRTLRSKLGAGMRRLQNVLTTTKRQRLRRHRLRPFHPPSHHAIEKAPCHDLWTGSTKSDLKKAALTGGSEGEANQGARPLGPSKSRRVRFLVEELARSNRPGPHLMRREKSRPFGRLGRREARGRPRL